MERMLSVKADKLKFVREYYEVSLQEVCERTRIKEEVLKEYEEGTNFPSYAQLERLAAYYNKPLFYFFSNYMPETNHMQAAFRKIEKNYGQELSKHTRELLEKADLYRINLVELFEGEEPVLFQTFIKDCHSDNELIERLRGLLDLDLNKQTSFQKSENFLEYLREKFFEIGIYVFKDSFKDDSISGLCTFDNRFPIILINNKTSYKRQIFTLLHEIYHIYLKEADIDYIKGSEERKCNDFSSNFLIPDDDLRKQINHVDEIEDIYILDELAKRYGVSRDALMYRLVKMKMLDSDFYERNCIGPFRQANNTSGGNFYFTKISYLGNSYLNKVLGAYYSGKISKPQVGIYTGLKAVHVSKLASKMIGGVF